MSDADFIKGLGLRSSLIHALPEAAKRTLTEDERRLILAAGNGTTLEQVLHVAGVPEAKAIALLLGLRLKGLVLPGAARQPSPFFRTATPPPSAAPAAAARPPAATPSGGVPVPDLAALNEHVDLDQDRKKDILGVEARLRADYFTLLGVPVGAEPAAVKSAYYELTKRFHPDRYFGKQLGSFKGRIDRIFKGMTEAQAVLTDPNRRKAYLDAHPELAPPPVEVTPESAERAAERRARIARHPYLARNAKLHDLVARGRDLIAKGDFSRAYNDLNLAAQIEPKNPEVQRLLGEARRGSDRQRAEVEYQESERAGTLGDAQTALSKLRAAVSHDPENPVYAAKLVKQLLGVGGENETREALTAARKLVEASPRNADARVMYGNALAAAGMTRNARREYEEVLKLRPEDPVAKEQLKKLRWKL